MKNNKVIVLYVGVTNCSMNNDPNTGKPRIDAQTQEGLVSLECLKAMFRKYIGEKYGYKDGYNIYNRKTDKSLDRRFLESMEEGGLKVNPLAKDPSADLKKALEKADKTAREEAVGYLLSEYFDIRAFGEVITMANKQSFMELNNGRINGPVQVSMGKSVGKIYIEQLKLTRGAITSEEKVDQTGKFGERYYIPYGLYRFTIYVSSAQAEKTGFSDEDFKVLLDAMEFACENAKSNARSSIEVCKMVVFEQEGRLFKHVSRINESVKAEALTEYPRSFSDYKVTVDTSLLPEGTRVYYEF